MTAGLSHSGSGSAGRNDYFGYIDKVIAHYEFHKHRVGLAIYNQQFFILRHIMEHLRILPGSRTVNRPCTEVADISDIVCTRELGKAFKLLSALSIKYIVLTNGICGESLICKYLRGEIGHRAGLFLCKVISNMHRTHRHYQAFAFMYFNHLARYGIKHGQCAFQHYIDFIARMIIWRIKSASRRHIVI